MEGFLLINKPEGPTSHDIVAKMRRLTGEKRIGHAGTLDPFASGLLIIGVGRVATREFSKLVGLDKGYEATLVFGASSDTQDKTGTITNTHAPLPTEQQIQEILPQFTGTIMQTPPMFSAKKVKGQKLYDLARAGKTIEREPVEIQIHRLTCTSYTPPRATISVDCGSGTYIRTLGHDIGQILGCGAYVESLHRTRVGQWPVTKAHSLADLSPETVEKALIPVEEMLASLL